MCPLAIAMSSCRVVVEVEKRDAEAHKRQRRKADAALRRRVSEQAALQATIECVHFEIEVGNHQIQQPVAVVVAGIDAHARARLAVSANGDAGHQPRFREPQAARVAEQKVRHRVVRDEHVGPPVVVVVADHDPEAVGAQRADARRPAHVRKDAPAVVAVQRARQGVVLQRVAVEADAAAGVTAERAVRAIGVDVIHHPEVEIAVAIQIRKRAARAPSRIAHARGDGHIAEGAVAGIPVERIRSVVGDVQVRAAVAIVVAGARAHAVLAMLNARAVGDVLEGAVAEVMVQAMTRASVDSPVGDRPAVDKEQVHPPVAVVVDEDPARPHGLDEVFLGACAARVVEHDARLARDIDEPRKRIVRARPHRGRDRGESDEQYLHFPPPCSTTRGRSASSRSTSPAISRRRRSSASRRSRSNMSSCRAASSAVAKPRVSRREGVPDFITVGHQLQRAIERDYRFGGAPRIEAQPADVGMDLRVAPVNQQRRHQLAKRFIRAAVRCVRPGQLFVNVRIVRVELHRLVERVDGARDVALNLREPGDRDQEHTASDQRPAEGGLIGAPRLRNTVLAPRRVVPAQNVSAESPRSSVLLSAPV